MKKLFLVLLLILLAASLVARGDAQNGGDNIEPEAPACVHEYVEVERIEPMPLKDGEAKLACTLCDETKVDSIPMTRKLKILTIGNSFVGDALHYLWGICNSAGMEDAVFGNANIGGASLDDHAGSILMKAENYNYTKYEAVGSGSSVEGVSLDDALLDEEWDYIVIQQLGHFEGLISKYTNLDTIIDYVSEKCPNAEIHWYMTWAYQQDSTHSGFSYHNNDQMTMYNATIEAVQSTIVPNPKIKGVIPCGTAMQNLRTSCIGDNITRDGYHAKPGIAKYTLSLTWYAYFTGGDIDDVKWYNTPGSDIWTETIIYFDVAAEAVENALAKPFEITQSSYTEPIIK